MIRLNRIGNCGCFERLHRCDGNRTVGLLIVLSFLTGCSFLEPSWNYDESISDDLVILNAERRVIFFSDKGVLHNRPFGVSENIKAGHDQIQNRYRPKVICAEPSPDVVTQLALSGGMKALTQPGNSAEANLAIAAASLRLSNRTQTIQLLRDGLYRACEAYFNGVLGEDEYKNIIKGYDELLITLVAIEGLSYMGDGGRSLSLTVAAQTDSPEAKSLPSGVDKTVSGDEEADRNAALKADKKVKSIALRSRFGTNDQIVGDVEAVAANIQKIVRDYYCFQLGLKEKFYPDSNRSDKKSSTHEDIDDDEQEGVQNKATEIYGPFSQNVLEHLCSSNGDVVAGTSNSNNSSTAQK